jgi:rubredoxin
MWTEQDEAILRAFADKGCARIQKELEKAGRARTGTSVYNKARALNIVIARAGATRIRGGWTKEEEAVLLKHADEGAAAVEAALKAAGLRRTDKAIRYHASVLGVPLGKAGPKKWTEEELGILRKEAVKGPSAAHRALQDAGYDRTIKTVRNKIVKLKLLDRICRHCGKIYRVHRGTRRCGHCGRTNFPNSAEPAKSIGPNAPTRKTGSRSQEYHARTERPMCDPWESGEIPQRPWFRTPDPMHGY